MWLFMLKMANQNEWVFYGNHVHHNVQFLIDALSFICRCYSCQTHINNFSFISAMCAISSGCHGGDKKSRMAILRPYTLLFLHLFIGWLAALINRSIRSEHTVLTRCHTVNGFACQQFIRSETVIGLKPHQNVQ